MKAQIRVKQDSIVRSWTTNVMPPADEKNTKEFLSAKKKIDEYRNELASRKNIVPSTNAVQADSCHNSGFESGDFSYWYRFDGSCSQGVNAPLGYYPMSGYTPPGNTNVTYNSGIGGSTFTLETIPPTNNISGAGYDPYAHMGTYTLPILNPQGGNYSCRINNNTHNKKAIKAEYVFTVPLTHPYFVYSYAVVMSDGNHPTGEQAGVRIKAMYMNGTLLPVANAIYETNVNTAKFDPAYTHSQFMDDLGTPSSVSGDDVYYRTWTTDTIFLCPLVGQNVRISFEALDCDQGAHWCYMYVDARCNYGPPLNNAIVQSSLCPDSVNFTLTAPVGFPGYQWYDHNGNPISNAQTGNQQVLDLNAYVHNCPTGNCSIYDGETFSVSILSPGGCSQSIPAVLHINTVKLGTYSSTPTCKPAHNGSVSINVSGGLGTYTYSWYANSCTGTPIGTTSSLNGVPPGNYCIHVASGQCPPLDTVLKVAIIPLVPQNKTEALPPCLDSIAYIHTNAGDSSYTWYKNGVLIPNENKDSLKISTLSLTATYQVTYINASGCLDSMIIKPTMNVLPVNLSSLISTPTCKQGHNGGLAINVTGGLGAGTYNFTWYANSCTGTPIGNANSITDLYTGNYCVHVTSGHCPPLDTVLHIGIIPMVPQYQTQSLPPCLDSLAWIHAALNDSTYTWYQNGTEISGQHNDSLLINPMNGSSNYQVTYYDNLGCLDTMIITPDRHLFETPISAVYCPKDSVATVY
ncbi:MAG: SprB repeat-containing protein, partial [Bacteroidia bacterium]